MPGYKTHLLGGMLLGLSLLIVFRAVGIIAPREILELVGAVLCGSLFPDIDTRSMGRRFGTLIFLLIAFAAAALGYFWSMCAVLAVLCVALAQPHRGITHRVWSVIFLCIGAALPALFFRPIYAARFLRILLFFALGAISHLILDGRLFRIRRRRR